MIQFHQKKANDLLKKGARKVVCWVPFFGDEQGPSFFLDYVINHEMRIPILKLVWRTATFPPSQVSTLEKPQVSLLHSSTRNVFFSGQSTSLEFSQTIFEFIEKFPGFVGLWSSSASWKGNGHPCRLHYIHVCLELKHFESNRTTLFLKTNQICGC